MEAFWKAQLGQMKYLQRAKELLDEVDLTVPISRSVYHELV